MTAKKIVQTRDYLQWKGHHMDIWICYSSWPKVSLIISYGSLLLVYYFPFIGHILWVTDSTKKFAQTSDYVPPKGHHSCKKVSLIKSYSSLLLVYYLAFIGHICWVTNSTKKICANYWLCSSKGSSYGHLNML